MRVLFLAHNLGKTRHFDRVIQALTDRGHDVTVCAAHKRNKPLKLGDFRDNPRVDVVTNPVRRTDEWEPLVRPLRQARDYLRYLGPGYAHANKLAERARAYAPPGWPERLADGGPWRRRRRWIKRALETAEDLVPSERYYELYLRSHAPDVVLVTPLIDFGSYQTDYVKSAHRLGLPVAFLPFSWDNLTNRGLVRIAPDRMLAWNETQKNEAITYHDVPENRIVVTGAARFDDFFEMGPSSSREEFCRRAGLDPSRPFLLYLCSSRFVAPNEAAFAREWVSAVRGAQDPAVAACGVLVRPHPANAESWSDIRFGDSENAAVWPEPAKVQADPALYDALYYSAAVAGLNTSAMIEAGILGKPVYAIQTQEFAGGQEQTLHFHYLLARNGGPVEVAATLHEHLLQVANGLANPEASADRIRRFIETFVRPRGLDRPVASILAEEIEHVAAIRKRPRRTPLWHYPARMALRAALTRGFGRSPKHAPSQP
ncbi:MAG: hypothetical protein O2930_00710 [Acidobacteria bacterium]|nr:hypothetical protein [Acidobacteriota bacterium]